MKIMTTSLRRRVIDAYGGESRWRESSAVEAEFSAWGWAFRLKWQRPFKRARGRFDTHRPFARLTPIDREGSTGVLEGADVRIEDERGNILASRVDARSFFPGGRRIVWWDRLDQTYFAGYALWNYMTLPALLLREDIEWIEIGERSLEGRFPPSLPTHCVRQRFHFHPETALLERQDYTAEVIGSWARASHVVLVHGKAVGLPYASKRRVTPRATDGRPRAGPLLIAIEIHDWCLV